MSTKPIIVITGATNGIGQLAAVDLAKHDVHLVLIARSAKKAEATRALIEQAVPGTVCDTFFSDFSAMDDVLRVGKEIADSYDHIDVLINNAGLHAFEQRVTKDGFPETIAVNYFAPWLLTRALMGALTRSGHSRVVNVASRASNRALLTLPVDLTDTTPFSLRGSFPIYGKSKLLNIMFNHHMAREHAHTNVTFNALCPGFNLTGLGRELPFARFLHYAISLTGLGDPTRGAGIIVYLAIDPEVEGKTGGFYSEKHELLTPVAQATDVELQKVLWQTTEKLLEQWL
jgi:NAD(P)-dependent dehydrogenase (short-subunit alcohol dehydrogenase family)